MTLNQLHSLVGMFENYAMEYFRLGITLRKLTATLVDYGVIVSKLPPQISLNDPTVVTKLKEKIIISHKKQQDIIESIELTGAKILDTKDMELLFHGGPNQDSFLSWQPGESSFGHWRESFDKKSERKTLKTDTHSVKEIIFH